MLLDQALSGSLNLSRLFSRTNDVMAYSTRAAPALGAIRLIQATNALSRKHGGAPRSGRSLEYLVSSFTMFETSNPHDVIYALLSVSRDAFRFNPQVGTEKARNAFSSEGLPSYMQKLMLEWWRSHTAREAFLVDYEAPYVAVYKRFISFCISNASPFCKLDILCRPWAPEPTEFEEDVPSWICTMASSPHRLVEKDLVGKRLVRRNADSLVGMPGAPRYNASNKAGPTNGSQAFKFHESVSRSMFVEGFILDEIDKMELPSQLGNIPPEWPKLAGWLDRDTLPPEAFWRTLVANRDQNGDEPPPYYPRACREVFQEFVDDTLDTSTMLVQSSTIITKFLSRVQAVIWNRRLVRTRAGQLGLVPKDTSPSDVIAILDGCSVPVILRKHYKTVGDLDREAKDDANRKQNAVEYIARSLLARYRKRQANRVARSNSRKSGLIEPRTTKPRPKSDSLLLRIAESSNEWISLPAQANQLEPPRRSDELVMNEDKSSIMFSQYNEFQLHRSGSGGETFVDEDSMMVSQSVSRKRSREVVQAEEDSERKRRNHQSANSMSAERNSDRQDWYWTLIGECYVHNMMDGQAAKQSRKRKACADGGIFEIR